MSAGIGGGPSAATLDSNRSDRSYAIVSLAAIREGLGAALTTHLQELAVSPFADVEHVHFARLMVLDQLNYAWPRAPRRRTQLRSAYLLFTASITADDDATAAALPESFLRSVGEQIPTAADTIWGHCVGYPGTHDPAAFASYLTRTLVGTSLFYVGYENATVANVRDALRRREALVEFAHLAQSAEGPSLLQQAYLEQSASWGF